MGHGLPFWKCGIKPPPSREGSPTLEPNLAGNICVRTACPTPPWTASALVWQNVQNAVRHGAGFPHPIRKSLYQQRQRTSHERGNGVRDSRTGQTGEIPCSCGQRRRELGGRNWPHCRLNINVKPRPWDAGGLQPPLHQRVINWLRKASDGDIFVPHGSSPSPRHHLQEDRQARRHRAGCRRSASIL